jgi:hypothetical protein
MLVEKHTPLSLLGRTQPVCRLQPHYVPMLPADPGSLPALTSLLLLLPLPAPGPRGSRTNSANSFPTCDEISAVDKRPASHVTPH